MTDDQENAIILLLFISLYFLIALAGIGGMLYVSYVVAHILLGGQ